MSSFNDNPLHKFLKLYYYNQTKHNKKDITHTRIPDPKKGISGGSYCIPENKMAEFNTLYYNHVFIEKKSEYLTEKQPDKRPLMIDFDFRYDTKITSRQHTKEHIMDIIELYLDELKELIKFEENEFPIYILEKPNINTKSDPSATKDGIHMIIGILMDTTLQLLLRENILKKIESIWDGLPLTNSWDSVLDRGISAAHTNWQLIGSKKPNNQAYKVTGYYNVNYDSSDGEFCMEEMSAHSLNNEEKIMAISARNLNYPLFPMKESIKEKYNSQKNFKPPKKASKLKIIGLNQNVDIGKIKTVQQLDNEIEKIIKNPEPHLYYIKETHDYTMLLPKQYYESGSYDKWIRVAMALHNTDSEKLFLTWVKLSSKAENFSFNQIPEMKQTWNNLSSNSSDNFLTYRSIMFWAKTDGNTIEYDQVRRQTVEYFVELSINDTIKNSKPPPEFDIARILYTLYKDRFTCVSIKNNIWFEFKNSRWHEIDSGSSLRIELSKAVHKLYLKKTEEAINKYCASNAPEGDDPEAKTQRARASASNSISFILKKTTDKNNIMREARELFYDKDFMDTIDNNPYLLGFNNGVFDFKENRFRPGKPDDYLTKSTNIDYVPIENIKKEKIDTVKQFIRELFPIKELEQYMWDHLGSSLIGTNENQTFNIYTGSGRNGKSMLVSLMTKTLGDYKHTVPITLITQKRPGIGSSSSEVAQLKGVRFAVMQEPTKGDTINEGIMKEITGGDPIQGRALYKDTITFVPQFNLVVCTNTLFDIKSNDDGTWRRIRVCDFKSKFTEKPVQDDPDEPYQFKVDKKLEEKFDSWKEAFMAILIEIARKTKGNVNDCKLVMAKSNEYREGQDYLAEFVKEAIIKQEGGIIKKGEIYETFKQWYTLQYGRGVPQGKELYEYVNKKFGKYKNGGWHNIAINYEDCS